MNPEAKPASVPVSDGSESARIAGLCGAIRPGTYACVEALPICSLEPGHTGDHISPPLVVPAHRINALLPSSAEGYWLPRRQWAGREGPDDV